MANKISKEKREHVWKASGGKCAYCGCKIDKNNFTVDHIVPQSKLKNDSKNDLSNLCASCKMCNQVKAAMTVKDFKKWVNTKINMLKQLESEMRKTIRKAEKIAEEIESKKFSYIHYLRNNINM